MKTLISFGSQGYEHGLDVLRRTAGPFFDEIVVCGPNDIDDDFRRQHDGILSCPRGFGYWLWKPYLIAQFLHRVRPGDFLMYTDALLYFLADPAPLFPLCADCGGVMVFHQRGAGHRNFTFTKMDCFNRMGCSSEKYFDGDNLNSAFHVYQKTTKALAWADEFLRWCKEPQIISDAPNVTGDNLPGFVDHRHDQSVLSLMAIKHGLRTFRDISQWGVGVPGDEEYGQIVHHHRDRAVRDPVGRRSVADDVEINVVRLGGDREWAMENRGPSISTGTATPPPRRRRTRLVIGILSAAHYVDRRMRCRRMWTHALPQHADAVWRFFVGRADGVEDREPDVVVLPCPDDYASLPQKTAAMLRWFADRYEFDFLFKCDDDTYVCVERLLAYQPPHEYCGWDVSVSFPGSPRVASGGAGYFLSRRAASLAVNGLAAHPSGAEDSLLGQHLAAEGIDLYHDPKFRWDASPQSMPSPANDLISAHWVNTDETERTLLRGWKRGAAADSSSQHDLVLRIGSRVIRWIIGTQHDRLFTEQVLLPWALPEAVKLDAGHRADFTVGVYLCSPSDVERVLDGPGIGFLVAGEPEARYPTGTNSYVFVQDERIGDDDHVRYAPMLCIWSPPVDSPPKTKGCSVIESKKRPERFARVCELSAVIGAVEGFGDAFGRPLPGYHCTAPTPTVFSKHLGLQGFAFNIAIERAAKSDYVTEKFNDPILCEAIPIYGGCPNILDYALEDSFVPLEDVDRVDWRNWRAEYGARRSAVVAQKELVRRYFNILGYFTHLTARLDLLDRKRPITLATIGHP